MNKIILHIVLLMVIFHSYSQTGFIVTNGSEFSVSDGSTVTFNAAFENNANVSVGNGSSLTFGDSFQNLASFQAGSESNISFFNGLNNNNNSNFITGDNSSVEVEGSLINSGVLEMGSASTYSITEDISNQGSGQFFNTGLISLAGNFNNVGMYNGVDGSLEATGSFMQTFNNNDSIGFQDLIMNGSGGIVFNNPVGVAANLDLFDGIIQFATPIMGISILESGQAIGGNENSFVQARMTHMGTGFKSFPIGVDGAFTLVELEDVSGVNPVYSIEAFAPLPSNVTVTRDVKGISLLRYWEFDTLSGEYLGSVLRVLQVGDEDLLNLPALQNEEADFSKPILVQSDTLTGDYRTMNEFETVESVVNGFVVSDSLLTSRFFALGEGPTIPPNGVLFVPNTFSPLALDPEDQVIKVYAERVDLEADFAFRVFNRAGLVVFETNDFAEANEIGWDGINSRTGEEVPGGTYTYNLILSFENGRSVDEIGSINYVR